MYNDLVYDIYGRRYTFTDIRIERGGWVVGRNKKQHRKAWLWPSYIQEEGIDPVPAKLIKGEYPLKEWA